MLVLAACSTLHYSGEQTARTVSQDVKLDSTAYRQMIQQAVHEEFERQTSFQEWMEKTTVKEILSEPDSTGMQHVTERMTTTTARHSEVSAVTSKTKNERTQEEVDSTGVRTSDSLEIKEEETELAADAKKGMPWYVYAAALLCALIVGFVLGIRINRE